MEMRGMYVHAVLDKHVALIDSTFIGDVIYTISINTVQPVCQESKA